MGAFMGIGLGLQVPLSLSLSASASVHQLGTRAYGRVRADRAGQHRAVRGAHVQAQRPRLHHLPHGHHRTPPPASCPQLLGLACA